MGRLSSSSDSSERSIYDAGTGRRLGPLDGECGGGQNSARCNIHWWPEAEPTHFAGSKQNLEDNGVQPENCKLFWARQSMGDQAKFPPLTWRPLLEPLTLVDLIDMDVQAAELEISSGGFTAAGKSAPRTRIDGQ